MPMRPRRPCAHPGCPALTDSYYCSAHRKQTDATYNKYRRDPAARKRYGKAWRLARNQYITTHPLCEECMKHSRLTPAREVHHIIPLSDGGTHGVGNLMALCTRCHSWITLAENNRRRG